MMRYAVLVAFVAIALQASARRILSDDTASYRKSIEDRIRKAFEQGDFGALRHRHTDEGYPDFDGNLFKQSIAQLTSKFTIEHLKNNEESLSVLFPIIKPIVKSALKNNWKSFEEYVDFWGAAINAIAEEAKEVYKKFTGEEYSPDSSEDGSSDFKSDVDHMNQWFSKLNDYFAHNNIDPNEAIYRNSIKNSEVDISDEFEVRAPWHGHADRGYPEFDGNPFKKLVSHCVDYALRNGLALFKKLDAPSDVIALLESAQKAKNFDEYLEFWGDIVPALIEADAKSKRREQLRQQQ